MSVTNPFEFLYQAFSMLLQLGNTIWNFLFSNVSFGNITFQPWQLIGGSLVVTLLVLKLIKDFVPMA